MDITSIVGIIGSALTTASQLPQVFKILKMKETRDISLTTYLMLTTGVALWIVYGILLNQPPIYIANIITFVLSIAVLGLKLKYG